MVRSLASLFGVVAFAAWAAQAQQSIPESDIPPHPTLPECQADDPSLIKPDLVPEVPGDVRTIYEGTDRQMQFTTSVGNIGPGPLILEGVTVSTTDGVFTAAYQRINRRDGSQCAHTAGLFVFHPQHKHWHFDRFVSYELRVDDPVTGQLVGGGEKMSFCLLDIQSVRGFNPVQFPRQLTTQTCSSAEGMYGISVGWEDVYEHFLPGQSIDLDPDRDHQVPEGSYLLVNRVNPDGKIWEADANNNSSFASVKISLAPPVLGAPPLATPTPGSVQNPQVPHLRPGRVRPTRAPRAPRPGTVATPTATRTRPAQSGPPPTFPVASTPAPTAVQPSSGPHQPHTPAGANPPPQRAPRPTRAPHVRPGDAPTPTPNAGPPVAGCENACGYGVSQIKLTWYDNLGLTFEGFINPGASGCEPLNLDAGISGTMSMVNWMNARQQDLGLDHSTSFTLGDGGDGATSDGGDFVLSAKSNGVNFTYTAPLPPPAHRSDGFEGIPVAFNGCITVGRQSVRLLLVCQAHTQGLLCHEG